MHYAVDTLGAKVAIIKELPGNEASLMLAKALGADYSGEEPSDATDVFSALKINLAASGAIGLRSTTTPQLSVIRKKRRRPILISEGNGMKCGTWESAA